MLFALHRIHFVHNIVCGVHHGLLSFSFNTLYDLEKELDSVFGSVFEADLSRLGKTTIMKTDKGVLANLVAGVLGKSRTGLHSAAVSIEELKSD